MKLRPNKPLSTFAIEQLVSSDEDLRLMWPDCELPFGHEQWRAALSESEGHHSLLWLDEDEEVCGHTAICNADEANVVVLAFVYLVPHMRKQSVGRTMVHQSIDFAAALPGIHRINLKVRTYNPNAYRCYVSCGFVETSREDTVIHMSMHLQGGEMGDRT